MANDSAANDSPSIVKESGKRKKAGPRLQERKREREGERENAERTNGNQFSGRTKEKRDGETHSDHSRF